MAVTILQFDNRPAEALGPMVQLVYRNEAYARRHGYQYRFLNTADADLPVYWLKPHFIRQALAAGADTVVWLDTDAVVHDQARRLEDVFAGPQVLTAAPDAPVWPSPFNAGVMAVSANGGLALMDRWLALFPGTAWKRTETAWTCEGEWAGADFEQGALVKYMLPELTASGATKLLDWRVLQSPFPVDGAFTLHFAGPYKPNIPIYLASLARPEL